MIEPKCLAPAILQSTASIFILRLKIVDKEEIIQKTFAL
jgi:hypothetical protein